MQVELTGLRHLFSAAGRHHTVRSASSFVHPPGEEPMSSDGDSGWVSGYPSPSNTSESLWLPKHREGRHVLGKGERKTRPRPEIAAWGGGGGGGGGGVVSHLALEMRSAFFFDRSVACARYKFSLGENPCR